MRICASVPQVIGRGAFRTCLRDLRPLGAIGAIGATGVRMAPAIRPEKWCHSVLPEDGPTTYGAVTVDVGGDARHLPRSLARRYFV